MRFISPGEFNRLPHLHCAGIETEDAPSYRFDGIKLGWKYLPRCIFQYTLDGCGCIDYQGTTYKADRGKAFIFPKKTSDVCYYYPPKETEPWHFIFCEFWHLDEAVAQLNTRYGPVYDLGEDSFVIRKLMALIKAQKQQDTMISGFESYEFCTEVIGEMCRLVELRDNGEDGSLAIKARNLIYKQRMGDFFLPELAKKLGVCPEHLCREFKRQLNDTPKHYHDRLRIESITEHLRNSDQPIKEIARKFGFDDLSNFNKFFKKHREVTPGMFRREHTIPHYLGIS